MNNGIQALTRQLDHLRDYVTHDAAHDVANLASSTGTMMVKQASGAKDLVVDRGGDFLVALSKTIKRNPIAAVGIAFGVGYLAMRFVPLIGRRSHETHKD